PLGITYSVRFYFRCRDEHRETSGRSHVCLVDRPRGIKPCRDDALASRRRSLPPRLPSRETRPNSCLPDTSLIRFPRNRTHLLHPARHSPRNESPRCRQFAIRNSQSEIAFMNKSVRLAMVGCTHRHSSLAVRERLAFTPQQIRDARAARRVTNTDGQTRV